MMKSLILMTVLLLASWIFQREVGPAELESFSEVWYGLTSIIILFGWSLVFFWELRAFYKRKFERWPM